MHLPHSSSPYVCYPMFWAVEAGQLLIAKIRIYGHQIPKHIFPVLVEEIDEENGVMWGDSTIPGTLPVAGNSTSSAPTAVHTLDLGHIPRPYQLWRGQRSGPSADIRWWPVFTSNCEWNQLEVKFVLGTKAASGAGHSWNRELITCQSWLSLPLTHYPLRPGFELLCKLHERGTV